MTDNVSVVLAARPRGNPQPDDFALATTPLPEPGPGQALIRNHYISLDAGFRNWMDEDSGDNVLPAMALGAPVMGLTIGEVLASDLPALPPGQFLLGRLAWQLYSVTDGSDFLVPLPEQRECPLSYYLGVLGDTGLSAYFGLTDIGRPQPGETVLVSAAGGAVGSVAGQIARRMGARAVGIAGGREKCARLIGELGYAAAVDHRQGDALPAALADACPEGIDVYFDNVGGPLLETVLDHINDGARIVLCGAVASYGRPQPGPSNLFQLVTRQATMRGFLTHTQAHRYPEARAELTRWIQAGDIVAPEYLLEGIDQVGRAFSDLFAGRNFGKTVVKLY
ncbi:MAG: NADP-dependent oxidoreductase [Pseudomonadales bacterium]